MAEMVETNKKYPDWAMERWERRLRKRIYESLKEQGILKLKGIGRYEFFFKFSQKKLFQ